MREPAEGISAYDQSAHIEMTDAYGANGHGMLSRATCGLSYLSESVSYAVSISPRTPGAKQVYERRGTSQALPSTTALYDDTPPLYRADDFTVPRPRTKTFGSEYISSTARCQPAEFRQRTHD